MSKKAKPETDFKPQITHIMADGSVRDSVEGYPVPVNEHTAILYRILASHGNSKATS